MDNSNIYNYINQDKSTKIWDKAMIEGNTQTHWRKKKKYALNASHFG